MIQLGKFQDLYIVKRKDFGVYVNDQKDVTEGSILLPAKQVPEHAKIGDKISCFVYKDSEDRPIATVHIPKITLGAIRPLRVKEVSKIGAFLDWGLEKDLFLPSRAALSVTSKVPNPTNWIFSPFFNSSATTSVKAFNAFSASFLDNSVFFAIAATNSVLFIKFSS